MGAFLEPRPHLAGALAHTLLHVDALLLVAREGEIDFAQEAALVERRQLILIEKIARAVLVAEKEPVEALGADDAALLQEGTERRHARARSDHDHRRVLVLRQAKG